MIEKNLQDLKDKAVLLAWIAGLLLLISIFWILTQGLQANYLMRSVNSVLSSNNDSRRLSSPIQEKTASAGPLGYWFSISNSTDKLFVFNVFQDGILVPLGAIVSINDKVEEVIPLSAHAIQVFDALPKSILQMYINRIESALNEGNRE